jgi:hypothetical protein
MMHEEQGYAQPQLHESCSEAEAEHAGQTSNMQNRMIRYFEDSDESFSL